MIMKAIKSLFVVAILAVFSVGSANAQISIQAGYLNSPISTKLTGNSVSITPDDFTLNGFQVGLNYNMPLMGELALQYGLNYSFLTKKEGENIVLKTTGHYLDVPVRVAFGFPLGSEFKIFVFGGPNFNIGLAGKSVTSVGDAADVTNKWYEENDHQARFNLQLGAGAGVQFGSIYLKAGYDWGLLNLNTDSNTKDNRKVRQNQLTASLGFYF